MLLLALLVIGARWIVLSRLGTDTPYWDQWDSEIAALYKPFVEGDFGLTQLFAPHNEHRIVFSRLFNLSLFEANAGQFDNQVECFANALLYAAVVLGFAYPILRRLAGPSLVLGAIAAFCASFAPYGWENLVSGFQNAFYFLNGMAILAIAAAVFGKRPIAIAASVVIAFLSLFTLASGLLTAAALAFTFVLRAYCGDLELRRALPAALACTAICIAGAMLLTPVQGHAALKAQGFSDLFAAVVSTWSWPLPPVSASIILAWWPAALTVARALRERRVATIDLYLASICAWTLLQACAVAWSRGHEMTIVSSRYTDTLALGAMSNAVLAVRFLSAAGTDWRSRALTSAVAASVFACFGGMVAFGIRGAVALSQYAQDREQSRVNLHAYVNGEDPQVLEGKPGNEISYPQAARLRLLLDDTTVRRMLPASIRPPLHVVPVYCTGFEYPGVPPQLTSEPEALGSYAAMSTAENVGECVRRATLTTWPYLAFKIAGHPEDPGMSFVVSGKTGHPVATAPSNPDGRWTSLTVSANDMAQWTARDANTSSWIAFSPPVEIGRLTMLTQRLIARLQLKVLFDRPLRWNTQHRFATETQRADAQPRQE